MSAHNDVDEILSRFREAERSVDASDVEDLTRRLDAVETADLRDRFPRVRVAVLTGYTSRAFVQLTRLQLLRMGIWAEMYEAPYGLFEQAVYGRDPEIAAFKPDLCFFCVGSDHLGIADPEIEASRWRRLWEAAHGWLGCPILLNTFETPAYRVMGNLEFRSPGSALDRVRRLNLILAGIAPTYVHFNDVDFLAGLYGRRAWRDQRLYDLAKIPVGQAHWMAYASNLAAVISAVFGRNRKCLVLDLDGTLWGGTIGDDGVSGILLGSGSAVGEAFLRFQGFLKGLKERGILLAVCSKNEKESALEPFRSHPEMILKEDDISCFVANWDPKADNLRRIAETLGLRMDSLVFVDDSPAERALVARFCPDVEVVSLPEDPAEYVAALSDLPFFEAVTITEADRDRTRYYRQEIRRSEAFSKGSDLGSFLRELEMAACYRPLDETTVGRVAQLLNQTNQFNLTAIKYTEPAVMRFLSDSRMLCRFARLRDRFGDNGLVTALLGKTEGDVLIIENWVMSCRVFKRGLEEFVFRRLIRELVTSDRWEGIRSIRARYVPTGRNRLVENLLERLGFTASAVSSAVQTQWEWDLERPEVVRAVLDQASAIREER